MQPSLTFLHLDANINLQTILTDKKRNNLVSKRNKIINWFQNILFCTLQRDSSYTDLRRRKIVSNFSQIFFTESSCVGYSFITAGHCYLRIKIDQWHRRSTLTFNNVSRVADWILSLIMRDFVSWIKRKYRSLLLAHCTDESELNYQPVSMLELTRITGPGTRFRVTRSICTLLWGSYSKILGQKTTIERGNYRNSYRNSLNKGGE